jgi:hypothetical protein
LRALANLALPALGLLLGCDRAVVPALSFDAGLSCDSACLADPVVHCVRVDDCQSSADCPTGADCESIAVSVEADAGDAGPTLISQRRCQAHAASHEDPLVLINGFGVTELPLQQASDAGPAIFSWQGLPGTSTVECFLFTCPPEVRPDGTGRTTIVNSAECVLFASSEPNQFNLSAIEGAPSTDGPPSGSSVAGPLACGPVTPRLVSAVSVGCLDYGPTALIGASRLLPLSPSQAPILDAYVHLACDAGDGTACYLGDGTPRGTCSGQQCLSRCLWDDDCAPIPDAGPDAIVRCQKPDSGAMGVCVE